MCINQVEERVAAIQDHQLAERAKSLPDLLLSAWADSTNGKYEAAWSKWANWCSSFQEIQVRPADPFHIALYFNDLTIDGAKLGAVTAAASGIRWGHMVAGFEDPMSHQLAKLAFEGAKRRCAGNSSSNQKEPFSPELMAKVIAKYGQSRSLMDQRFVVLCLLGFAGFLRRSELSSIQVKNLRFFPSYLTVTIPFSKTDQLREGHVVHIAKSGSPSCPVEWVHSYLGATGLKGEDYLFCRLAKTKVGHNALGRYPISFATMRTTFFKGMEGLWDEAHPKSHYSLHSLRSGGASAAANNNVPDRLIGKHGRWKSNKSRNTYIKDSVSKRLVASSSLGL